MGDCKVRYAVKGKWEKTGVAWTPLVLFSLCRPVRRAAFVVQRHISYRSMTKSAFKIVEAMGAHVKLGSGPLQKPDSLQAVPCA
jgi:hypothetical protein